MSFTGKKWSSDWRLANQSPDKPRSFKKVYKGCCKMGTYTGFSGSRLAVIHVGRFTQPSDIDIVQAIAVS
jgi:hypothetical protein